MVKKLETAKIYWVYDYDLSKKCDEDTRIFQELMATGHIDIVQFRAKNVSLDDYLKWCESLLKFIPENNNSLIVANDFCESVEVLGLDGVHIGQNDLSLAEARSMLGDKIIGATARSIDAAIKADRYADYIGAGTVFQTTTKAGLKPAGPQFIKDLTEQVQKPVFPIGGINSQNAIQLAEYGIYKAAVASCLLHSKDPLQELLSLCKTLK